MEMSVLRVREPVLDLPMWEGPKLQYGNLSMAATFADINWRFIRRVYVIYNSVQSSNNVRKYQRVRK